VGEPLREIISKERARVWCSRTDQNGSRGSVRFLRILRQYYIDYIEVLYRYYVDYVDVDVDVDYVDDSIM
jgi:hypothetical protein